MIFSLDCTFSKRGEEKKENKFFYFSKFGNYLKELSAHNNVTLIIRLDYTKQGIFVMLNWSGETLVQ